LTKYWPRLRSAGRGPRAKSRGVPERSRGGAVTNQVK
jgi:hypothetical protein